MKFSLEEFAVNYSPRIEGIIETKLGIFIQVLSSKLMTMPYMYSLIWAVGKNILGTLRIRL